jgi:hypothetical protein
LGCSDIIPRGQFRQVGCFGTYHWRWFDKASLLHIPGRLFRQFLVWHALIIHDAGPQPVLPLNTLLADATLISRETAHFVCNKPTHARYTWRRIRCRSQAQTSSGRIGSQIHSRRRKRKTLFVPQLFDLSALSRYKPFVLLALLLGYSLRITSALGFGQTHRLFLLAGLRNPALLERP